MTAMTCMNRMIRTGKVLLASAALIVTLIVMSVGCMPTSSTSETVADAAPVVEAAPVADANRAPIVSLASLEGSVVILDFWAVW